MKTILTFRARADLRAIVRYIARDNRRRALSFAEELIRKCDDIASMPEAFPFADGHADRGIRRRVHGAYLIYYTIDGSRVVILNIINASRHIATIPFNDD